MAWHHLNDLDQGARDVLLRRTARLAIYVYHQLNKNVPFWIMQEARKIHPTNRATFGHLFSILLSLEPERRQALMHGHSMDSKELVMWYEEALVNKQRRLQ